MLLVSADCNDTYLHSRKLLWCHTALHSENLEGSSWTQLHVGNLVYSTDWSQETELLTISIHFFYVLFIFVLSPTFCMKNINFADLVTRSAHQKDVLSPLHLAQCNAVSHSLTITYQNVRKFLLDGKFFFYHFYEDFIISKLSIYIFFSGILRGSPERLERSWVRMELSVFIYISFGQTQLRDLSK